MAGRPTLLTQEMIDKANTYLETCIMEIPCKEGLALYLGVRRQTLYDWCKLDTDLHKQFLDIWDEIMGEQGKRLLNGGLYGRFNATITKLMLSKHDYIEKQQTENSGEQKLIIETRRHNANKDD